MGRQGVTIIELVIVVSIIAIISLLAAPQITSFQATIRANEAVRKLVSDMQLARSRAIFENMEFRITYRVPTANQYQIANSPAGASSWTTLSTETLPSGIAFGADVTEGPGGAGDSVPTDGVGFTGDLIIFRNTGTASPVGTIYVMPTRDSGDRKDRIRAVKLQFGQTAKIKAYRYDGAEWNDF